MQDRRTAIVSASAALALPVGIAGASAEDSGTAGHAFQQMTSWHLRRPIA